MSDINAYRQALGLSSAMTLEEKEEERRRKEALTPAIPPAPTTADPYREKLGLETSPMYQRRHGVIKPEEEQASTLYAKIAASDDPLKLIDDINSSRYLAETFKIDQGKALANLDQLSQYWLGKSVPAKTFAQKVKTAWDSGVANYELGLLGRRLQKAGGSDAAIEQQIAEVEARMPRIEEEDMPRPWLAQAAKWLGDSFLMAVESAPSMGMAALQGAALGAATGGTAGALAGAALSPVTVGLSVPALTLAMTAAGSAIGATQNTMEFMSGLSYLNLRKKGIPNSIASTLASIDGTLQGALESAEVIALFPKIPGVNQVLNGVAKTAAKKIMASGSLSTIASRFIARTAGTVVEEGLENGLQDASGIVTEVVARELAKNEGIASQIPAPQWDAIFDRVQQSVYDGMRGSIALGVAGGIGNIKADLNDVKTKQGAARLFGNRDEYIDAMAQNTQKSDAMSDAAYRETLGAIWDEQHKTQTDQPTKSAPIPEAPTFDSMTPEQQKSAMDDYISRLEKHAQDLAAAFDADPMGNVDAVVKAETALEAAKAEREQIGKVAAAPEPWQATRDEWVAAQQSVETQGTPDRITSGRFTLSEEERSAAAPLRSEIARAFPSFDDERTDLITAYVQERAAHFGQTVEEYAPSFRAVDETQDTRFQGKRGGFSYEQTAEGLRGIVHATSSADISTAIHELAHGEYNLLKDDEVEVVRQYASGLENHPSYGQYKAGEIDEDQYIREVFSTSVEKYLSEKQAPEGRFGQIIARIGDFIRAVYQKIAGHLPELTPEIRGLLDQHFGLAEQTTQTAEVSFEEFAKSRGLEAEPPQMPDAAPEAAAQARAAWEKQRDELKAEYETVIAEGKRKVAELAKAETLFQRSDPTESEAFRRYFGDSQVVDEQGRPLVVYHGTYRTFEAFDKSKSSYGGAFYFTPDRDYAHMAGLEQKEPLAVYLSIKNPYRGESSFLTNARAQELKAQGYDGIIGTVAGETDKNGQPVVEYVAFEPTQVKSVANRGTWDTADARMLYQPAAPVGSEAFKEWFGKSRVVDEDGDPLVLYHQTEAEKAALIREQGFSTDERLARARVSDGEVPNGIFFKPTPQDIGISGSEQIPVYLSLQNPLIVNNREQIVYAAGTVEYSELARLLKKTDAEYQKQFDAAWAKKYENEDIKLDGLDRILAEWKGAENEIASKQRKIIDDYLKDNGYDGVILENDRGSQGRSTKAYIALRSEQVKSVTNRGTWDPNDPRINYQGDPHEQAVRDAVEAGEPVPDKVLDEYADRDWAKAEIIRRSELREDARLGADAGTYTDADDYADAQAAMDIEPRSHEYYRAIWNRMQEGQTDIDREVADRRFMASISTKEALTNVLHSILRAEVESGIAPDTTGAHFLFTSALEKVRNDELTDAHYKKLMDQMRDDPGKYRRIIAESLHDEAALAQLAREAEAEPEQTELEKTRESNRELRRNNKALQGKISSILSQIDDYKRQVPQAGERTRYAREDLAAEKGARAEEKQATAEAMRSAGQEARLQTEQARAEDAALLREARSEARLQTKTARAEEKQAGREKLKAYRDAVKTKEHIQSLVRGIMRPAGAAIDYEYAERIAAVQASLVVKGYNQDARIKAKLQEWMEKHPGQELNESARRALARRDIRDMTVDELEEIAEEVRQLRYVGKQVREIYLTQEREYIDGKAKAIINEVSGGRGYQKTKAAGSKQAKAQLEGNIARKIQANTLSMQRLSDLLGSSSKAVLWDEVNRSRDAELRAVDKTLNPAKEMQKKLGITAQVLAQPLRTKDGVEYTRDEVIHMYIAWKNADSRATLAYGNNLTGEQIAALVKQLTPEQIQWADYMLSTFSGENWNRLLQAWIKDKNRGSRKVENYFPIRTQESTGAPMHQEISDDILSRSGAKRSKPGSGFMEERIRIKPEHRRKMRLGATAMFYEQVEKQEHYIATWQLSKRLQSIFNNRQVAETIAQRYGRSFNEAVQVYVNELSNPAAYRIYEPASKFLATMRNNVAVGALAFNLTTVLNQFTGPVMYLADAGPVHMLSGLAQWMGNPKGLWDFVTSRDPQILHRNMDTIHDQLRNLNGSAYQKSIRMLADIGLKPLEWLDTWTCLVGWKAVYDANIKDGEAAAIKAAQDSTLRTQPSGTGKDLPLIYHNNGAKMFLMFSRQLNQIWNMWTYDMPMAVKKGKILHVLGDATAIALTGLLMGMLSRKRAPENDKEWAVDITGQFISSIPFVGNDIVSGLAGYWWSGKGVNLLPFVSKAAQTAGRLADEDQDAEAKWKALVNLMPEVAQGLGLPGVALGRVMDVMQTGDPWDLVGGPPKPAKE